MLLQFIGKAMFLQLLFFSTGPWDLHWNIRAIYIANTKSNISAMALTIDLLRQIHLYFNSLLSNVNFLGFRHLEYQWKFYNPPENYHQNSHMWYVMLFLRCDTKLTQKKKMNLSMIYNFF